MTQNVKRVIFKVWNILMLLYYGFSTVFLVFESNFSIWSLIFIIVLIPDVILAIEGFKENYEFCKKMALVQIFISLAFGLGNIGSVIFSILILLFYYYLASSLDVYY